MNRPCLTCGHTTPREHLATLYDKRGTIVSLRFVSDFAVPDDFIRDYMYKLNNARLAAAAYDVNWDGLRIELEHGIIKSYSDELKVQGEHMFGNYTIFVKGWRALK